MTVTLNVTLHVTYSPPLVQCTASPHRTPPYRVRVRVTGATEG